MVLTIVSLTRQGLKAELSEDGCGPKNRLTMSSAQDCCYPARPGSLFSDLRVHFLNRNHLLGGVSVQRHRGGKAAVQGGVVMHFVLQRAAANQLESSIAWRPAVVLMM